MVQPVCALACAKALARGHSARTPAADDVFSGRGYISSLPSAALNSFHVGRFSACARPTQRRQASTAAAAAGSFWGREAGVPLHQSRGDYFPSASTFCLLFQILHKCSQPFRTDSVKLPAALKTMPSFYCEIILRYSISAPLRHIY